MITFLTSPANKVLAHFRLWLCFARLGIKALTLLECQRNTTTRVDKVLNSPLCYPPGRQQTTCSSRDTFSSINVCVTKMLSTVQLSLFLCLTVFLKGVQWLLKKSWIHVGYIYIENEYLLILVHVVNLYTSLYCLYAKTLPSEEVISFWKFSKSCFCMVSIWQIFFSWIN